MKILGKLAILSVVFMFGCNKGSDSPIVGVWATQSCLQGTTNGELADYWAKGNYEFTVLNGIIFGANIYSDSDCISKISTSTANTDGFSIIYQDLGVASLDEGIEGRGISIETGPDDQKVLVNGYYTINNNTLCLSEAFTLDPLYFSTSLEGSTAIDFTSCLTKP